jgi:serine/threonine protein kinase
MVQCLYYLQKKGVMHRDLKPQNILLDANMNLKFVSSSECNLILQIDFGDAKKVGEEPLEEEVK